MVDFTLKGKRTRKIIDARNESDAIRKAQRMHFEAVDIAERQPIAAMPCSLRDVVDEWKRHVSPSGSVVSTIETFVRWAGPALDVGKVSTGLMQRFAIERLRMKSSNGKPIQPTTLKTEFGRLRSLCRWAVDHGFLAAVPKVPWPRAASKPPAVIPMDEIPRILNAVRGHGTFEPFYCFAFCGLRRGEILAARWENVSPDCSTIAIPRAKTKSSAATIPIFGPARTWTIAHQSPTGWIVELPKSMARSGVTIAALIHRWNARSDVKLPNPHRCRHTIATELIRNGASLLAVQKLLRHSSPIVTARVYVHADAPSFAGEIVRSLPPALRASDVP